MRKKRITWRSLTAIMLFSMAFFGFAQTGYAISPAGFPYIINDLGTLGGDNSRAYDVNNNCQVVGGAQVATGKEHAFLWENGFMTDLGTLPGHDNSRALAINNNGTVIGESWMGADVRIFFWDGTMKEIGVKAGTVDHDTVYDINNNDDVVGMLFNISDIPFLYEDPTDFNLNTDTGVLAPFTALLSAPAINDWGQIVGHGTWGAFTHAYLLTPGPDYCPCDIATAPSTWYPDSDGDTYGDPTKPVVSCVPPAGYVTDNTDCNDANAAVNPGATEVCNGIDDDCDGLTDEFVTNTYYRDFDGDGYGNPLNTIEACSLPAGYVEDNTDCLDTNIAVYPGAPEICDGLDNNCDGVVPADEADADGDGYRICEGDCDDGNSAVNPGATEVCNYIDDDCDGLTDEGVKTIFYRDFDGDGYGDPFNTVEDCLPPPGYIVDNTDCDDTDPAVNPGATEICHNLIDDNCNGLIDEGDDCYCDVNSDGVVNFVDVSWVRSKVGTTVAPETAFLNVNGGTTIDSTEYKLWLNKCYIQQ